MDRYEFVNSVGKGGNGKAMLVRSKSGNELFVIKEMKDNPYSHQEAQILRSIYFPLIVKYVDQFQYNDSFCIVMEYAEGGTLRQKMNNLQGQPMKNKDFVKIFAQLCLAIQFIHNKNIIHRDSKP